MFGSDSSSVFPTKHSRDISAFQIGVPFVELPRTWFAPKPFISRDSLGFASEKRVFRCLLFGQQYLPNTLILSSTGKQLITSTPRSPFLLSYTSGPLELRCRFLVGTAGIGRTSVYLQKSCILDTLPSFHISHYFFPSLLLILFLGLSLPSFHEYQSKRQNAEQNRPPSASHGKKGSLHFGSSRLSCRPRRDNPTAKRKIRGQAFDNT